MYILSIRLKFLTCQIQSKTPSFLIFEEIVTIVIVKCKDIFTQLSSVTETQPQDSQYLLLTSSVCAMCPSTSQSQSQSASNLEMTTNRSAWSVNQKIYFICLTGNWTGIKSKQSRMTVYKYLTQSVVCKAGASHGVRIVIKLAHN